MVGENDEMWLQSEPTDQEIHQALLSIPTDSSPGLDGLGLFFIYFAGSWFERMWSVQ